ncbi:hypothetical protein AVEN_224198-1 [Araneus ventricosus]|uniref:Uncharacterized protein n=1 Tax=Araneus ventricosus TaxID=182803 RepID=A0A4Y2EG59_ARAVE|nr:hypothetical protein AVEN_224198-1 [Araneus ventricosus]
MHQDGIGAETFHLLKMERLQEMEGFSRDSIQDPQILFKSAVVGQMSQLGVEWKFGQMGCYIKCRPRHLYMVQNFEVCPKVTLDNFKTAH